MQCTVGEQKHIHYIRTCTCTQQLLEQYKKIDRGGGGGGGGGGESGIDREEGGEGAVELTWWS